MNTTTLPAAKQSDIALPELADQANHHHELCVSSASDALDHAHTAGDALRQAKQQCTHGDFGPWVRSNFHGSTRTARLYMQVSRRWPEIESKRQRVAVLGLREAARLTAPGVSTPPNMSMPVETDYANSLDYYEAFMKAWWDDLERRSRALHEQRIQALRRRLAGYTTIQQVLGDYEPTSHISNRYRLEMEKSEFFRVVDTVSRMAQERIAELENARDSA